MKFQHTFLIAFLFLILLSGCSSATQILSKDWSDRSLSGWTTEQGSFTATNGYLEPTGITDYNAKISIPCTVTQGTWKFRYKYAASYSGLGYNLGICSYYLSAPNGDILKFDNAFDGHFWLDYKRYSDDARVGHNGHDISMLGSQLMNSAHPFINVAGTDWHDVVFVRENNFTRMWIDGN